MVKDNFEDAVPNSLSVVSQIFPPQHVLHFVIYFIKSSIKIFKTLRRGEKRWV